ncbi:uncharacterized protein CC84DRAFT_1068612, partial [Paraphaeosphaeria sporulosa]
EQKFATVIVGLTMHMFLVHETLLTHYSKFFRAALQRGFAETEPKTVTLKVVEAPLFEIFVHWLYHRRLRSAACNDDKELVAHYENSRNRTSIVDVLVKLYVFGDVYQLTSFRKVTLRTLFHHFHSSKFFPLYSTFNLEFAKLSTKDPLCRLIVDWPC